MQNVCEQLLVLEVTSWAALRVDQRRSTRTGEVVKQPVLKCTAMSVPEIALHFKSRFTNGL